MLGTIRAIAGDTFLGIGTDRASAMGGVADRLSLSLVPTSIGLLIGLQSLWCYKYLRGRLDTFDREMAGAGLQLVNQLAFQLDRLRPERPLADSSNRVPYLETYAPALADIRSERRSYAGAGVVLFVTWCIEVAAQFEFDASPLNSALGGGLGWIVLMFCCSCLPAYAIWVDILHRKATGVAPIAATLCFLWCVAGLFVPAMRF